MATLEELTARLEALETMIAAPRAAVPPITIGELADVPAPGSPIAAAWAQEVSARVLHRFATPAALAAGWSAAANKGAHAIVQDSSSLYVSNGASWYPAPIFTQGVAALSGSVINGSGLPAIAVYRFGMFCLLEGYCQLTIAATADSQFTFATAPVGFRPGHTTPGTVRFQGAAPSSAQISGAQIQTDGSIQGIGTSAPANSIFAFSIPFVPA